MSSLNGDSKKAEPSPPSPAKSPTASRHKTRPPSIGDASQLFGGGGGGGLEDFFGPSAYSSHPSQQSPSVFGPLAEEAEPASSANPDPNDPFAWPVLDQSTPSNQSPFGAHPVDQPVHQPVFDHYSSPAIPSTGYDNSYNPIPNPGIPLNHTHSHSAPNHQIYPPSDQYASDPTYASQDQNQAYSAYPQQFYGPSADHNPTGLGISNTAAPYHSHTQSAYDNYNPYGPQNPYSTPNLPHLAADPITRSVSVNSLPSPQNPQDAPSLQRPGLAQALTSQPGAALSLNRPKVYDAYDPPAIRKKKPLAVGTTASLPSSPALGGQGAMPQFAATSLGQALQSHVLPPPPKQRSTSTPAHAPPLTVFTRHDHSDFYGPTGHAHGPQSQFVPPTYSDAQSASPVGNRHPSGFIDSSHPTNLALETTAHPLATSDPSSPSRAAYQTPDPNVNFSFAQPAYPGLNSPSLSSGHHTSQLDDPYAPTDFNPAHSHPANNQTGFKLSQDPQSSSTLHQSESGYSCGRATSPLAKTADSHSSPPIGPYQPDRVPTPPSPAYAYGPPGCSSSSSLAVALDRRPKKSSPLKMAVSANEASLQNDAGHSTGSPTDSVVQTVDQSQHPAEALPHDPVDQLDLAAQRMSLNATPTSPSAFDQPKSETSVESHPPQHGTDNAQSPPLATSASDPPPPALSSGIAPKTLSVPDVHVQPATPEISLIDARDLTPASNFDVLADLGPGQVAQSTSQPVNGPAVPSIDYGYGVEGFSASEDPSNPYGAGFNYGPSQVAAPENPQLGYTQLPATSESSDKSLSQPYNPYSAPLNHDSSYADLSSNGYLHTGTGQYAPQQPSGFAPPNPYDPYAQSSPYSPTDNAYNAQSTYGSLSDGSQARLGIQPESSQSDVPMESSYLTGLNAPDASLTEPHQSSIYNTYDPGHHPAAERSGAQAEDPMLERLKARVAVASFGFGGKLITVLPGSSFASPDQLGFEDPYQTGGVMPADPGSRTTVTVQQLTDVIPSAELQAFPGPLFMDGGNRSSVGKKRKEIVGWLEAKLSEAEKELVFVQNAGAAHQPLSQTLVEESKIEELQDKIVLLKLLRVLIDNEGKLSGTPKVEEAVRSVLHSTIGSHPPLDNAPAFAPNPTEPRLYDSDSKDVIATYTVRSSSLDSIQSFLANGDRPQALRHAVEQKMWAHALVIANSLGPDVWRETVREFARFELSDVREAVNGAERSSTSNGKEGLRTLYNLFAGAGPAAVDEFFPSPSVLAGAAPAHHPEPYGLPAMPIMAPNGLSGTSRVSSPIPMPPVIQAAHSKIPKDVLQQWRTTVALTIANRVSGSAPFLLKLGDTLVKNGRVYAGHVTYLLSNGLTPLASLENGARIGLLGWPGPTAPDKPGLDVEAVMLTEVLEFGLSLAPVAKSQEQFIGIAHLQAYRLALGTEYATLGLVNSANKYCEALAATLKLASKPCAFYHGTLVEQLKAFSGRLSATPVQEKGSSWITRKMARPTLDNVWQTLEGRVHKFVAGEDDGGQQASTGLGASTAPNKALGPFSHYSSISPGSTSGTVSRVQSSSDLRYSNLGGAGPFQYGTALQRPSSGADYSTSVYERDTRQRSSSAMVPKYGSGSPSPTYQSTFGDYATSSQALLHGSSVTDPTSPSALTAAADTGAGGSSGGWWEAASRHGTPASGSHPTFATVEDAGIADDGDGFIDPMASFGVMPSFGSGAGVEGRTGGEQGGLRACTEEDEEDLGFGNSSSRKREPNKEANNGAGESAAGTEPTGGAAAEKEKDSKGPKHVASGSWLGRWFKRDSPAQPAGSGPVKANLGEGVSLVYDPETKRWVNKTAGQSPAPASGPPPPPARAQTASPTSAMGRGAPPPPGRSATAGIPNGRNSLESPASGLAPTMLRTASSAAHFGGSSAGGLPPPPLSSASSLSVASSNGTTGTKKAAGKKNLRSRYVEIR